MSNPCEICAEPATQTSLGSWFCSTHLQQYAVFRCSQCGQRCLQLREMGRQEVCGTCVLKERIKELSDDELMIIRQLLMEGDRFEAIKGVMRTLQVDPPKAAHIIMLIAGD